MNELLQAKLDKLLKTKEQHNNIVIFYIVKTITDPANKLTDQSINNLLEAADHALHTRDELYKQIKYNLNVPTIPIDPATLDSH